MPQFPKMPRVLLIDVKEDVDLRPLGFEVNRGSFGVPFRVRMDDHLSKVPISHHLPGDLKEHDVVFVDLSAGKIHTEPIGKHSEPLGEKDWWAANKSGLIDPRAKCANQLRDKFESMLSHGTVFVVFAAPSIPQEVTLGRISRLGFSEQVLGESLPNPSVWSFLGVLHDLQVTEEQGNQMEIYGAHQATPWLKSWMASATYKCTIEFRHGRHSRWVPWDNGPARSTPRMVELAHSRHGKCVAAIFDLAEQKGTVLILPQFADHGAIIESLLVDFLPKLRPDLFGIEEGPLWLSDVAFASPAVLELEEEIRETEARYLLRLQELTQQHEAQTREYEFMHMLLSGTGDELVEAVKTALIELGFLEIEVVDDKMGDSQLMEDLRISDESPILLVEVKGVDGRPRDEDVLQAQKYVAPRMKEWKRTDVQALSIVNYERQTAPIQRTAQPFRDLLLDNAARDGFGIMTTFDLFRLVRNVRRLHWAPHQVKPLFYRAGRISTVPTHYTEIGRDLKIFPKVEAVVFVLTGQELRVGDTIAVQREIDFFEGLVESIQVDSKETDSAEPGTKVGIRTNIFEHIAKSDSLYLVDSKNVN